MLDFTSSAPSPIPGRQDRPADAGDHRFFEDKGLKQIKRDWQSPVPDARRFDQIWVEQVHALKGAYRMRD